MSIEEKLPEGWVWTTLGEISTKPQYGWTTKAKSARGAVLLLRTTDISGGTIDWDRVPYCTEVPENLADYLLRAGDLVISRAGSVGLSNLLGDIPKQTVFASYLIRFRPLKDIEPRYIAYYLQTSKYWKRIYEESSGIALANVNARKLETIEIPLAPFTEQHRIVAAIEQQFTRLDSAVASLHSVQARVKQYRAALLKSAVEGELTKEWRTEHLTNETGTQLLERILTERRKHWEEEEMAKMRKRGTTPKDDKWKQRYKEPQGPDVKHLPELPQGWCWANLGQIASFQNGKSFPSKDYTLAGVKLLRPGNLYVDGSVQWTNTNTRYLPEIWAERNQNWIIFDHELIMNLTAQSLKDEFLGRVCITSENERCLLNQRLARITTFVEINRHYILYMLKSFVFRRFVDGLNTGSLIQHMFTSQLENFSFPLPPLSEQTQIVAEVEAKLSNLVQLEVTVEVDLKRAEQERQSILSGAFTGLLVPQEPSDEPARVLLERIREEREKRDEAEKAIKVSKKGIKMGMTKRRLDKNARSNQQGVGLYKKLVEIGEPLPPDDLFRYVGLKTDEQPESVEVFYEELHVDVANDLIVEDRPSKDKVLLYAIEQDNASMEEDVSKEGDIISTGETPKAREEESGPSLWDE